MTPAASPETPAQTAPAAAPARARRRVRVGWVLLLLLTLLFMAIAFTLVEGLQQGLPDLPWAVVVNGQDLWQLLQHHMRSEDAQFGAGVLLALLVTIALVLLPLVLVLAALLAVLLPVLAAGLFILLTLSPLLAVGALLWWLLRPARSASIRR